MSEVTSVNVENKKLSKSAKVGLGVGGVLLTVGAGFGIKKMLDKRSASKSESLADLEAKVDAAMDADKK